MTVSVIIPIYNEEGVIGRTIQILKSYPNQELIREIIVVDGGSIDNSINEATNEGAKVIPSPKKGRSAQMNEGARLANGSILYFLHADSIPPPTYAMDIHNAFAKGFNIGCYRLIFDYDHWFLKVNAWFTRFDIDAFRFGDQSLFVSADHFNKVGGFCEKHIVMEDQEIIKRLRKNGRFTILPKAVVTSARKYIVNGVYKMQGIFFLIFFLYQLGFSQQKLLSTYKKLIHQDKL